MTERHMTIITSSILDVFKHDFFTLFIPLFLQFIWHKKVAETKYCGCVGNVDIRRYLIESKMVKQ